MQARTIIDRIEIEPQTGIIGVRMRKQVVDDAGNVLVNDYHRTSIEPGANPAEHMAAVNTHLETMGFPPVPAEDADVMNKAIKPLAAIRTERAKRQKNR